MDKVFVVYAEYPERGFKMIRVYVSEELAQGALSLLRAHGNADAEYKMVEAEFEKGSARGRRGATPTL